MKEDLASPLKETAKNARKARRKKRNGKKRGGASGNNKDNNTAPQQQHQPKKQTKKDETSALSLPIIHDENLPKEALSKDPRGDDPSQRIVKKKGQNKQGGRNTESFDPESTLVRPDLRVQIGSPNQPVYRKPMKHDDVVIVPELFGPEDDWKLYYQLVQEITDLQRDGVKGSEWMSWHEGAHLIVKNPEKSVTFNKVIDRLCEYFSIQRQSVGTRFNWYKDASDWKPFHHDSA